MTISYTAPPLAPEINPASPFYPTLQSYVLFNQGVGRPRDVVHNSVGRRYSGPEGTCFGEDARWLANTFPFNGPSDGSGLSGDWSIRSNAGTRSNFWAFSGNNSISGHATPNGVTYFAVFRPEDLIAQTGTTFLVGNTSSPISGGGLPLATGSYAAIEGIAIKSYSGTVVIGVSEWPNFGGNEPLAVVEATLTAGHWYAVAVSMATTAPTSGVSQPRHVQLHDLTTDTRICGSSPVTLTWAFGTYTGHGYQSQGAFGSGDLCLFPGSSPNNTFSDFYGQVKLIGVDQQYWPVGTVDFPAPSGFGGVAPFDAFVANIYGMVRSTYATGSTGTTIINSAPQTNAGTTIAYQNRSMLLTGPSIPGCYTDLGYCYAGDSEVVGVSDTALTVAASRPQGVVANVTSYSLYQSAAAPITIGAGSLVATQAVSSTTSANIFTYTPTDKAVHYFVITATDGTHTYIYNQCEAACRPHAPLRFISVGNSYETQTGGGPTVQMTRAAAAFGADCGVIPLGFDGSIASEWTAGSATRTYPFGVVETPLAQALAVAAREAAAGGRPIDAAFVWLVENDVGDGVTLFNSYMSTLSTALRAGGNIARVCLVGGSRRALANVQEGLGEALGLGLVALDDGINTFAIGPNWLNFSVNDPYGLQESHPSIVTAQVEATVLIKDYFDRIVSPVVFSGYNEA